MFIYYGNLAMTILSTFIFAEDFTTGFMPYSLKNYGYQFRSSLNAMSAEKGGSEMLHTGSS